MKKFSLLFAFLLTLFSGTSAWAETASFENSTLPEGWDVVGSLSYYTYTGGQVHTGSGSIYSSSNNGYNTSRGNYIRTKKLSGDITFWYRRYNSSNGTGYIVLYYLNDDGSLGDKIQAYSSTSSTYTSQTYTISTPTRLAIVVNYAYLDDVSYEEYINKTVPWGLEATNITATSATLTWNASTGGETSWKVQYSSTSDFSSDVHNTSASSTATCNISGLADGTIYYVRVCADSSSDWSEKISFKATNEMELTVNEGTTNSYYVPFYYYYMNTENQGFGQFIIPKASLESIKDRKITKLTFYANNASIDLKGAEFDVYLQEYESQTTFTTNAFNDWTTLKKVYGGTLSIGNNKTMEIVLDEGFLYNGDNLLVGFKKTKASTASVSSFAFISATGSGYNAIYYSSSYTRTASLPKVTFTTLPNAAVNVTGVSVSPNSLTLDAGQESSLSAIITPGDATDTSVTWSSDDETVATVDANGLVTAVGAGTATITVTTTDGGFTATCEVTVNAATAVTGVSLNKDVTSIFVGSNETLTATVSPENASNKAVTWTSSDETVATVDNGVVTALKAGTTTITVTTVDGNFTATCAVTVQNVAVTGVELDKTTVTLKAGATVTLTPTISPANATIQDVTWNSDNTDVATVANGVVTAVAPGTANITVTTIDGSKTATCVVTVTPTLTVHDGTATSAEVPVYGNWADAYLKAEFVLPAAELEDIDGGSISGMSFYLKTSADAAWTGTFQVFMKEVESTNINAFAGTDDATTVYTGTLDATGSEMSVDFQTPYNYNGSNLLIGIYQTTKGNYKSAYFYGETVSGASVAGYNSSSLSAITAGQKNFLPKTTFAYTPGTPKGKMVVSTDAIDFGKITPASSAEDKQKTFTIANNTDKAALTNISVTYTDEYATDAFSLNDNIATSIAAGGEAITVTVTMDAATAGNYTGTITINADDQTEKTITVTGEYGADPATMAVTLDDNDVDGQTVAYGNVNKVTTKTFSVTNDGDLPLNATITVTGADAENFIAPASINVAGGTTETFDLTFTSSDFDIEKTATVTLTADELSKSFTVTATMIEMWSEDFSGNALPAGWESDGSSYWTFSSGVAQGVYNTSYNMTKALTTPALVVTGTSDVLTFKYKRNNAKMAIKKIKDNGDPEALYTDGSYVTDSDWQTYTITNLEAGTYKFQFMNEDYQLDDFEGFKLYVPAAHEAEIKSTTIAATGNQFVEYTASVDVKVTGTNNEELTAKFYIGETQYGSDVVKTVNAGDTETFTVTFTPQTAISGDAYFTIESADIAAFESSKTAVNIAAATVLDETVGLPDGLETGTKPSLVLNYTAKDGWNTIAVPFALTDEVLEAIFGEDYKIFELKSFEDKVITFQHATKYNGAYAAGYPFLVYVATAATHANGVVLFDVNVSTTTANYDTKSGVTFQSTYAPMAAGSLTGYFGATTDGEIRKAGEEASLKGFRAYFTGIPEGVQSRINFLDDDIPTGISAIEAAGQLDNIYNLNGQKVQSLKKGLYIINGKKVVIK